MKHLSQSPTDPEFVQNPYPFYAHAREFGDFIYWEEYKMVCAVSARAANAVLRDRRMGRTPPADKAPVVLPHTKDFYAVEEHSMLELEPPHHTRLRRLVLRAFTSRKIASMENDIETLCYELVRDFPSGEFDLLAEYCTKVPVIVIARLLGVPEEMSERLLNWSNRMVTMYQARRTQADEADASMAAKEFATFMRAYIDKRRKTPADDLITDLIAAEEDGSRLSTDEMITTCILLLNAGHEATVHTLGNAVKSILEANIDPEMITANSVPDIVEETLRYDPPLHMFTRWIYEPLELFGAKFEPGTQVAALLGSAGRDAITCSNPDQFDPKRGEFPHVAFGAGLHFCVGAPLARLEMQIALRVLFSTHPKLQLSETPKYANLFHFHGLERLMVQTS